MSQIIDNAKPTTSNPAVQCVLDIMEEYEATHTNDECARMWEWIKDYCKASLQT